MDKIWDLHRRCSVKFHTGKPFHFQRDDRERLNRPHQHINVVLLRDLYLHIHAALLHMRDFDHFPSSVLHDGGHVLTNNAA